MVTELMSDPLVSFTGFNCNLVSFLFEKGFEMFENSVTFYIPS